MKWTVRTNWFPYALSNLSLDLAKATNGWHDEHTWDSDRKLRIPMENGNHRVFEIKNHTTVVAWDEDGSGEISCPTVTYYRVGIIDGGHLDQLLMATLASQMAVMSLTGRRGQKK